MRNVYVVFTVFVAFCALDIGCAADSSPDSEEQVATVRESLTGPTAIWATYGGNCNPTLYNNAGPTMKRWCGAFSTNVFGCSFPVGSDKLGDPAPGCKKDMRVYWTCPNGDAHTSYLGGEAAGESLLLNCPNRYATILDVYYNGAQDPVAVDWRVRDACAYSSQCVIQEETASWLAVEDTLWVRYGCRDAAGNTETRWAGAELVGGGWFTPPTLRLRLSCNYSSSPF